MQFLLDNSISYDPENLFEDVQTTVYNLHTSGHIHREIASDLGERLLRFAIEFYHLSLFQIAT